MAKKPDAGENPAQDALQALVNAGVISEAQKEAALGGKTAKKSDDSNRYAFERVVRLCKDDAREYGPVAMLVRVKTGGSILLDDLWTTNFRKEGNRYLSPEGNDPPNAPFCSGSRKYPHDADATASLILTLVDVFKARYSNSTCAKKLWPQLRGKIGE